MAKASINFAKASSGGLKHNDRTEEKEPEYLLPVEHRLKNEVDVSAQVAEKKIKDLFATAKENYSKNKGQKLQASSYIWEAVINLNKEHTLEDVQRLVKEIEKETGFTAVQSAIHRDEGRVERGTPIYNLHAHVTFFTLDQNGEQLYRKTIKASDRRNIETELLERDPTLEKGEPKSKERKAFNKLVSEEIKARGLKVFDRERLSKLQDLTAEVLKMERGKKGSKAVRLDHKQYKAVKQAELAKVKDLKEEIKELRAELKEQGAGREDYAKLEALNKELKEQVKDKDLTISDLKKQVNLLRHDVMNWSEAKTYKELYEEAKLEIQDLKTPKNNLEDLENSSREQKNIIFSSYQEKVFYSHYQHSVREDLKGFYVDTSRDDKKVILSHKEKEIKIVDTGEKLIAAKETKDLQAQVKIMIDIAQAKDWNLLTLNIEGNKEFKKEADRQISELLAKNKPIEAKISSFVSQSAGKGTKNDSSLVSELVRHTSETLKSSVNHERSTDILNRELTSEDILKDLYNKKGREKEIRRGSKLGVGGEKVMVVEIDKVDFEKAFHKVQERVNRVKQFLNLGKTLISQFRSSVLKVKKDLEDQSIKKGVEDKFKSQKQGMKR